jgi:hypothetical protein
MFGALDLEVRLGPSAIGRQQPVFEVFGEHRRGRLIELTTLKRVARWQRAKLADSLNAPSSWMSGGGEGK